MISVYKIATISNIPEIKSLWHEVFGDTDDYIHRFISHFGIENGYICEINGKIVAMTFAISSILKTPSNFEGVSERRSSLIKYVYACATHPTFQSQGIMAKLLNTIYEDACKENVAGIFLQAANQSLANYYQKLGFEDFFFRDHSFYYNHTPQTSLGKKTGSLQQIIPHTEYRQKRAQKLGIKGINPLVFVEWNADFFRFAEESGIQFCEYENTIFSFKKSFHNIIVDELLGDTPKEQIAHLLFEQFPDFEVVHIHSMGDGFCCGQIKWCAPSKNHPKKGYFAFAME
jgi:GNAT superfamily N-acetyltransferase